MARLGDYVNIKTGKLDANAANENGLYPFFTCSVEPLTINTYHYDCECVLVAGNGDLNVKYYNGKFDAYQRTYIIESKDKAVLSVPYLYSFLDKYVETLRKQSIGGVIKYIKLGNLTEAEIPLHSIEEQCEIVKKFEIVNGLISVRKKQLEKLDQLVKSRFIEMFGDPNNNQMGWNKVKLAECLTSIENGKSFVCDSEPRTGEEPAVLKLSAATYGYYRPFENKAMLDDSQFVKSAEVHKGDLLFTRKNTPELVGMSAFVYDTPPYLMMPDLIFRLNTKDNCNKVFLWKIINLDLFRANVTALSSGSAKSMSNISKERLLTLEIILPPVELQNDFAAFVEQIDKSKLVVQESLEKLETLKKSLIQKYFG
ncbi:MAG: restriction endonuclease subunit S [Ruminococcaceae bacterium]|nr:restriction endonuclease subunit S [Oscillospiraceae bacterium]